MTNQLRAMKSESGTNNGTNSMNTNMGSNSNNANETLSDKRDEYQILVENIENNNNETNPRRLRTESLQESFSVSVNYDNELVYCRPTHPNINLLLYITCYIIFLLFGACIFTLMEQPVEMQVRDQLMRKQQAFLAKHTCVDVESLNSLLEFAITAQQLGVDLKQLKKVVQEQQYLALQRSLSANYQRDERKKPEKIINEEQAASTRKKRSLHDETAKVNGKKARMDTVSDKVQQYNHNNNKTVTSSTVASSIPMSSNWEFTSSLLFVTSVFTTIGYGHVKPTTELGKIVCIIFTCIGIPATLTLLSTFVALLIRGPIKKLERWLSNRLMISGLCRSIFAIRVVHLIVVTSVLLTLCFIIPALVYSQLETDWSFLDALYYCYISLTTIGLGDFVPATSTTTAPRQQLYRLGTIVYLYLGLTMMMLWLALIYRIPQFSFNKLLLSFEKEVENNEINDERARILSPSSSTSKPHHQTYGSELSTNKPVQPK